MNASFPRVAVVAALMLGAATFVPTASAGLSAEQTQWLARASHHEKAGWTYLHIEGGPRERGFQHGYLLAKEIAEALRVDRAQWLHDSGLDWSWLVAHTKDFINPAVDPENRAELEGIVEGAKAAGVTSVSYDDLVAENASFELQGYWWPLAQKKMDGVDQIEKPKQSCSSFIATGRMTKDGGIVLGHNTWFGYIDAVFNVVLDIVPAQGHRILMQTKPGWIHSGTDFFLTDAGLVGSETTIGGFQHFTEKGVPEFVRMRRATQDAANIDEWCAIHPPRVRARLHHVCRGREPRGKRSVGLAGVDEHFLSDESRLAPRAHTATSAQSRRCGGDHRRSATARRRSAADLARNKVRVRRTGGPPAGGATNKSNPIVS